MPIPDLLSHALVEAMRQRDRAVMAAVRTAQAALSNAQAVPATQPDATAGSQHFAGASEGPGSAEAARRTLSDAQQRTILQQEIAELSAHAEQLRAAGRDDEADGARRAIRILTAVLTG